VQIRLDVVPFSVAIDGVSFSFLVSINVDPFSSLIYNQCDKYWKSLRFTVSF